jgi:DNA invertase Pin-like site-specific DNA recombinase
MTTTWIQPLQTGKLVFQIIGAVAEFEKDIIRERVVAGLENAKQKGKQLGRPKIHDGILKKAKDLRKQGISFRKIEKQLGVGEGTIRKTIKKEQPRNM